MSEAKHDRNKQLIELRLEGWTYQELGKKFGISWNRARTICLQAWNRELSYKGMFNDREGE